MPVFKCPNGKYRIGRGQCVFKTKASAESAERGFLASGGEKRKRKKKRK